MLQYIYTYRRTNQKCIILGRFIDCSYVFITSDLQKYCIGGAMVSMKCGRSWVCSTRCNIMW